MGINAITKRILQSSEARVSRRLCLSLFMCISLFATSFNAGAQVHVIRENKRVSYEIYFRFDNAVLDLNYRNNAEIFEKIDSTIAAIGFENIESLEMYTTSSPEGGHEHNVWLSKERSKASAKYLSKHYSDHSDRVTIGVCGEAWAGLREAVAADSTMTDAAKESVFKYLDSDMSITARKNAMYRNPSYQYIKKNIFPSLRVSLVRINLTRTLLEIETPQVYPTFDEEIEDLPIEFTDEVFDFGEDNLTVPMLTPKGKPLPVKGPKDKMTIMALKTNLLYDAVTALNFEVEIPIGGRFSIMAEDVFPWWETGNKYCFEMWEIGFEGRYWFKPWEKYSDQKLRGPYAGIYAMSSKYDFQYDRKLNYQGEYWSTGVTAGWSLPVGKKKWARLDFSLSAGFLQTDYRHYMPTDSYDKLIKDPYNIGKVSYFGPTKAKVCLSLPINVPYRKKGGNE